MHGSASGHGVNTKKVSEILPAFAESFSVAVDVMDARFPTRFDSGMSHISERRADWQGSKPVMGIRVRW